MEMVNLPLKLELMEVGFGELDSIDLGILSQYDLVITSGAHLEKINKDYHELTYLTPFYPLHYTESDFVKGLIEAKQFGDKVMLMHYTNDEYNLEYYENLLQLKVKRLYFSDLSEAEELMVAYHKEGYQVVLGTSSVCEIAERKGINNIFLYSKESLKLEIIKAYQLATTKNKMVNYAKINEKLMSNSNNPIFLLDQDKLIIDTNSEGVNYLMKTKKNEIIGEQLNTFLNIKFDDSMKEKRIVYDKDQFIIEPILMNDNVKMYVVVVNDIKSKTLNSKRKDETLTSKYKFGDIIHNSSKMKKILLKTKQYAQSNAPIIIFGESGTGKELIAHSVHQFSDRSSQNFLPVNCSAIPQNILESELFGYEEGAFTGAKKGGKPGFFELAQHGTIFLDEIGELPLEIQTKLLRVLQEKEVIRLGGKKIIPLDVRVITATNKSLIELIRRKEFREDLYFRINVLQINIPPVRERKTDIPLILKHLLIKFGIDSQQAEFLINREKERLLSYSWPGNVREMENFTQRFCALKSISNTTFDLVRIFGDIIEEFLEQEGELQISSDNEQVERSHEVNIPPELEKLQILSVLLETNGNKNQAAGKLGMSRTTLWRKIKQYDIDLKM